MILLTGINCTKHKTPMFNTEQNTRQTFKISSKNDVLFSGTTLAKHKVMNSRITHKEITMIFGVLIALIVAFTLWMRSPSQFETHGTNLNVHGQLPALTTTTLKRAIAATVDVLL
jgi:hypothetical protein